ncbi:MAG: ABC transporter permease [Candidatus Helarchaeota archaeon]|nr:ABC transporter permease [Candidatus Helarchaeota archaeon]
MTSIIFSFKEGIKGFRRAKLSSFVSIFAIFISLSALGIFTLLTLRIQKILNEIKNKVDLEAIIDEKFGESEIKKLTSEIKNIEGVENVEFISKEKAAKRFQESFGEDISQLYGDNPLPISFIIKVKKEFLNKESMDKIVPKIENLNGITETIFKRELFLIIERYWKIFRIADLVGGILIALASIFIISNTIKITIYAKSKTIEIMKLIGATDSFIKRPFLFEGLTQGIMGGIFSCIFIYLLVKSLAFFLEISVEIGANLYLAIVLSGAFLGYIGYLWSVKKFLT